MRTIFMLLLAVAVVLAGCSSSETVAVATVAQQEDATFGVARGGAPTTKNLTVTKPFVPAGTVTTLATSGGFAPAPGQGLLPGEDPVASAVAGVLYSFDVTFTPPPGVPQLAGAAPLRGSILLDFMTVTGISFTLQINLIATIEAATFELGAASIDLGKVALGESRRASIILNNPNIATPVVVSGVALAADAEFSLDLSTTVFPFIIDPQSNARIPLVYTPTALVFNTGSFTVTHSVGGPVSAAVRGEGMVGEIVVVDGFFPLDANGETDFIDIDLPTEASSISIFCSVPSIEAINIIHFEGPSGTVYTRDNFLGPWFWFAVFPNGLNGDISAQFPNSDSQKAQLESEGGTYRLRASDIFFPFGDMYIRVTAELRAGGVPTKGQLPLNIYLAQGLGISVADAPNDAKLQAALESADQILGQAGLRIGQINYHVLTDPFFDVPDPGLDVDFMFEVAPLFFSAPVPTDRFGPLNLYFVSDFAGGNLLGLSGAVCGPRLDFDSVYNGVVVGYDNQSASLMGVTTAHEIGHFLALLHTVESDDITLDIIEDTEECFLFFTTPECPVIGNNNLMFPFLDPQFTVVKPGQGHVILRHGAVAPGHPATLLSGAKIASNTPNVNAVLQANLTQCATCQRAAASRK